MRSTSRDTQHKHTAELMNLNESTLSKQIFNLRNIFIMSGIMLAFILISYLL